LANVIGYVQGLASKHLISYKAM